MYNVVIVFAVQQSDSIICVYVCVCVCVCVCVYVYPFLVRFSSHIDLPYRLSQNIG